MSRFVYGVNPVLGALKAHPRDVVRVLVERGREGRKSQGADRVAQAAAEAGVRIEAVPQGDLGHRSRGGVHQGVGAELTEFRYAQLEDVLAGIDGHALLLVLDGVTDPQNLGALVRSAHALGAHGVVVPKDRAAGITPAAFKAAAGALEHCPVARVTNVSRALEHMKELGIWTVALAAEGDKELRELDLAAPTALVLGSEGSGVRPLVRKTCDHVARIPMTGEVGSLNVAAAGAVALYEVARQRSAS
ncbi:MAG TPA: 23S rRNA (guanosine(2251)-2'-O)-methyltransferase RlmB [Myxococcales bacterium]|nr:23S rRNA (guanosine(2251)-2'-O)-methyltransferase RlmB [Myxococcales bacterium]